MTHRSSPLDAGFRPPHIRDLEEHPVACKGSGVLGRPQQHSGLFHLAIFLIVVHRRRSQTGTSSKEVHRAGTAVAALFQHRQIRTGATRGGSFSTRDPLLTVDGCELIPSRALHWTGVVCGHTVDVENVDVTVDFYLEGDLLLSVCGNCTCGY